MSDIQVIVLNLSTFLASILAMWLKARPEFSNKLIPWVVLVFQGVRNLVIGSMGVDPAADAHTSNVLELHVAQATVAVPDMVGQLAQYLHAPWWLRTVVDTAVTIGVHGFTKNGLKQGLFTWLRKVLPA